MKKILLIEDNIELAGNFSLLLEDRGFIVYCASSGIDGLKLFSEKKIDLILCDIMLPDINGYKILQEMNKLKKKELPVFIFITAKTQRQDFRKGMEIGADDYLTKPFTFEELLTAINVQFEKRKSLKGQTGENEIYRETVDDNSERTLNYNDYFFFDDKKNPGFHAVNTIVLIKSLKDYSQIILSDGKKILIRKSMKYWENKLPSKKFSRVHKQAIINLDFIEKVEPISSNRYSIKLTSVNGKIDVSQRYSKKLKKLIE
jgi:DNA-binding LytR/AlgR family response regulator